MALNQLLEPGVGYCSPADVSRFFQDKTFDNTATEPSRADVGQHILEVSEFVDNVTRRAWRERKVEARELRVRFSSKAKNRARRRRAGNKLVPRADPFGQVNLPHESIRGFDSNEGDKLETLTPRHVEDITSQEGREDGDWVLDEREGILKIRYGLFRRGPQRLRGTGLVDSPEIRITYRYGREPTTSTVNNAGDLTEVIQQPGDLKRATAMRVAGTLIDSDQYSDLVPGGDAAPDQVTSSDKYREQSKQILRSDYRYAKVL